MPAQEFLGFCFAKSAKTGFFRQSGQFTLSLWSLASLQYLLCPLKGIVQIRPKQIAVCGEEFSGGSTAH